jgi:deoxyadenosine/deoxycytidine kinase
MLLQICMFKANPCSRRCKNVPQNLRFNCTGLKYLEPMYSSIAIEGGIGAGKSTFATWLAQDLGAECMLERFEENPFLEKFYENPDAYGFSVELSFLADRYKQMQQAILGRNLFKQRLVCDYAFAKSLIFAKVNLPKEEFELFKTMFLMMAAQLPSPEVIAILDPGRAQQEAQILARGRSYEQALPEGYLDRVAKGYEQHFKHGRGSRVLWIDTSGVDFVAHPEEKKALRDLILEPRKPGVHRLVAES